MRKNLVHKRSEFFSTLTAHSDRLVAGASATLRLVEGLGARPDLDAGLIDEVNVNETSADDLKATFIGMLFESFTTPISRDLLYTLITDLDAVLDTLQGVANNIATYSIRTATPAARSMAALAAEACRHVRAAVAALADRKGAANVLRECAAIDVLAARANAAMRAAVSELFVREGDEQAALHAIRMHNFHFRQAKVLSRCRRVARTIEEVVLENP